VQWRPLTRPDGNIYSAPAPILADVTVNHLNGVKCSPGWPALIDSGADKTIVPSQAALHLGLKVVADVMDRTFTFTILGSNPIQSTALYVQLSHPDFGTTKPLSVAHMNRPNIIMGRDFLNEYLFVIHGPKNHFIIHQNRSSFHLWLLRLMPRKNRSEMRPPED
jgi:hypothetical protein